MNKELGGVCFLLISFVLQIKTVRWVRKWLIMWRRGGNGVVTSTSFWNFCLDPSTTDPEHFYIVYRFLNMGLIYWRCSQGWFTTISLVWQKFTQKIQQLEDSLKSTSCLISGVILQYFIKNLWHFTNSYTASEKVGNSLNKIKHTAFNNNFIQNGAAI